MGDFAFYRYQWTEQERQAFFLSQRPPQTISDLPSGAPMIGVYTYAHNRESTSQGPALSSPQFRRVNSCRLSRILIFDLFGPNGRDLFGPLLAVPSNNISPTQWQLDLHLLNLKKNKHKERTDRVPLISQLLHSGRAVTDYTISAYRPLFYDNGSDK